MTHERELEIARLAREAETKRAEEAEAEVAQLRAELGRSQELLLLTRRYALVVERSHASIHADRVHAMACAIAASGKLPLDATRAVEIVDAVDGAIYTRQQPRLE